MFEEGSETGAKTRKYCVKSKRKDFKRGSEAGTEDETSEKFFFRYFGHCFRGRFFSAFPVTRELFSVERGNPRNKGSGFQSVLPQNYGFYAVSGALVRFFVACFRFARSIYPFKI